VSTIALRSQPPEPERDHDSPPDAHQGTPIALLDHGRSHWAAVPTTLDVKRGETMETPTTQPGTGSTLQAYEDKIAAQIHAANVRIDEFEAKAKPKRAQAEINAINGLKAGRKSLERMLADLKTKRDAQLTHAKADLDKAITTFQSSLEDFRRKFTAPADKK
jgi:hypothetical protein